MDVKVQKALKEVMSLDVKRSYLIPYAQSYAQAALDYNMSGNELQVQLLYVLSNLGGWRGEQARRVKQVLKQAAS